MRALRVLLICVLALSVTACIYVQPRTSGLGGKVYYEPSQSTDTSIGSQMPKSRVGIGRKGKDGRTPADITKGLVEARNAHAWRDAYALYYKPELSLGEFVREADLASEHYAYFEVLETRMTSKTTAICRVVYNLAITPPQGARYEVRVGEPGEWWSLTKSKGVWRINWLPRQ
ncbi:MAG TPA: hypothetical protein VFG89_05110 [Coriobacteriia bacterium]|nr:hypothetical protein [Coriobacteriia bacterium]